MVPVVTLRRISIAELITNPHAAFSPSRSSRRRRYATKGTASRTIQSFPTICPSRNSSEPKASQRNTIESTIKSDDARSNDRSHQSAAGKRRIDRKIGKFREQECGRRGQHQRRWRKARRDRRAGDDRANAELNAEAPLDQIAQHQRRADHQHAGRRHDSGRHRHQARAVGNANSPHMPDHPVGGWNGQAEQHKKNRAFNVLYVCRCRSCFPSAHEFRKSLRSQLTGRDKSPQP